MIVIDDNDVLAGDASTNTVVDYVISGYVGTAATLLAQSQLSDTPETTIYTSGADATVITSITLVNTHSAAVTVNLFIESRRIIPEDMSLGIGYSLYTDGQRIAVTDASGNILYSATGMAIDNLSDVSITSAADHDMLYYDNASSTWKNATDSTILSQLSGQAAADFNMPNDQAITFGDAGEKVEGNGTDLTVTSSNLLNLSAATDIIIPVNVGLKFGDSGEHIETNNTDFTITSGGELNLTPDSDVVIPVNKGLHFGDGAEKIESDNTNLTINSGGELRLTATSDVVIPVSIGLHLGDGAEKLESNNTDLTINSGGDIALTATDDINIPVNVGLEFAGTEKIESDGTDLSITVGSGGDINVGADIGITFGDDGEKIEGDGTDLTISSSGVLTLSPTGNLVLGSHTGVLRGDSGVVSVDSDVTDLVSAASTTAAGKVEMAIGSEVNTGTSTTLAVTPDALDDWTGSAQITTLGTISTVGAIAMGGNAVTGHAQAITDNAVLTVDDSPSDDEFCRFTTVGIEGLTVAEAITALLATALPENVSIILDPVLSADGKWSGITQAGIAGVALAFGDLVYLESTGKWLLAKADGVADTHSGLLGMVVLAANGDTDPTNILLYGKIQAATLPTLTVGEPVYVSEDDAGDVEDAIPTGSGEIVRIVGYGATADDLFFCPDNTYIELA